MAKFVQFVFGVGKRNLSVERYGSWADVKIFAAQFPDDFGCFINFADIVFINQHTVVDAV